MAQAAGSASAPAVEDAAWLQVGQQAIDALRGAREREGVRLTAMLQGHIAQLQQLDIGLVALACGVLAHESARDQRAQMAVHGGLGNPQVCSEFGDTTGLGLKREMLEELGQLEVAAQTQSSNLQALMKHLEDQSARLGSTPSIADVEAAMASFRGKPQSLQLPTAPAQPLVVTHDQARPQPRLDCDLGSLPDGRYRLLVTARAGEQSRKRASGLVNRLA